MYRHLMALLLVCGTFAGARACDTGWRYMGQPWWGVWALQDAMPDPADSTQILIATFRDWQIPGSGGIYACAETDTMWRYLGLIDQIVWQLAQFPYYNSSVFAMTDWGLYLRTGDTTWSQLWQASAGSPTCEFSISPYDTSLWVISDRFDVGGFLSLSRNSGQNWTTFYHGGITGDFLWSRISDHVLYFSRGNMAIARADLTDSTFSTVFSFPDDDFTNTVFHSESPWFYVCGHHHIGRFDESSGDTLMVPLPIGVTSAVSLAYTEDGLLVSTSSGFYRVSDDLASWKQIPDTVNRSGWKLIYTSPDKCLALGLDGLFESGGRNAVSPRYSSLPATPTLAAYPNPFNCRTEIRFTLTNSEKVSVRVFDLLGHEVRLVEETRCPAGEQRVVFDGEGLPSGMYFCQLVYGAKTEVEKLLLIR
jgi:hypothetical protein